MTENNAAQPGLTDDEIRDIITDAHQAYGAFKTGYGLALVRAIESALLSKLRAEGVQAGDERAAFASHVSGRDDLELYQVENVIDANSTRWATWRAARDYYQQARAALASAPVAGEAAALIADMRKFLIEAGHVGATSLINRANAALAAPQASEAVRDADPLQGAADWLMQAFEPSLSASDLARQLVIGYNRATRLRDAALKTQADKDGGGCAKGEAKRLHGLVEEAISWLETGGGRADSLCADLRRALAAQKQDIPANLMERLRHHAADKSNTAFARSTMTELAGYLDPQHPRTDGGGRE